MPFAATCMPLEIIILSEVHQKDKYHTILLYMWNLKYDTNKPIYKNRITDIENRLERGGGKGGRDGDEGGRGESGVPDQQRQTGTNRMGKQQVRLYSPENYIQQNEKEYEKECI